MADRTGTIQCISWYVVQQVISVYEVHEFKNVNLLPYLRTD